MFPTLYTTFTICLLIVQRNMLGNMLLVSLLFLCFIHGLDCSDINVDVGSAPASFPPGHLQPLGSHQQPEGTITELDTFPDPYEFFTEYVKKSRPVVIKGGARNIPAYKKWDDEYLNDAFGDHIVDVELGKKENRSNGMKEITLQQFIHLYGRKDIYMVYDASREMRGDLVLPLSMQLGGFQRSINTVILWFSSGGTKSVLHFDQLDNINCIFDGSKRIVFIDKKYKGKIESVGFQDQGSFSKVNVEKVDMLEFPQFADMPFWEITLQKGDCVFIPVSWYHHVDSSRSRNLAVNLWFEHLLWFDKEEYDKKKDSLKDVEILTSYEAGFAPGESHRTELFEPFVEKESLSLSDVKDNWTNKMGYSPEVIAKVFSLFDVNSDGHLTWSEIYRLSAVEVQDEFVNLGLVDYMEEPDTEQDSNDDKDSTKDEL